MISQKNRILLLVSVLLASTALFYVSKAQAARVEVESLRHWSTPNYTRVVIDLSGKAKYTYHLLKKDAALNKPRRLYIDITGASLKKGFLTKVAINDGLLRSVRAGQNDKETVRVVLDLDSLNDYKVFPLSNPFRIVIDVTGKEKVDEVISASDLEDRGKDPSTGDAETSGNVRISTIVIDAGHGGKDPGAMGRGGLMEKDVTLKIARLLKKKLSKRRGSNIILTRNKDVFIPLDERTAIAKMKKADLFVSIHINASPNKKAHGVETYYLDFSNDKKAMAVASRENNATEDEMGDVLQFILKDLTRTSNRKESSSLAGNVQTSLAATLEKKYKGIKSNGIKGAPFYVLMNAEMPSILVEVSFITNPRDEKRLRSARYLDQVVSGITEGLLKYIKEAERG